MKVTQVLSSWGQKKKKKNPILPKNPCQGHRPKSKSRQISKREQILPVENNHEMCPFALSKKVLRKNVLERCKIHARPGQWAHSRKQTQFYIPIYLPWMSDRPTETQHIDPQSDESFLAEDKEYTSMTIVLFYFIFKCCSSLWVLLQKSVLAKAFISSWFQCPPSQNSSVNLVRTNSFRYDLNKTQKERKSLMEEIFFSTSKITIICQ